MISDGRPRPPRVAAAFAAGAALPVTVWLLGVPALGAAGALAGATPLRPLAIAVLAAALGGALAGAALGRGRRAQIAYGLAFGATLWLPLVTISAVPALGGHERFVTLLVGLVPPYAAAFGLIGGIGALVAGGPSRRAAVAAGAGLAAGALGGVGLAVAVTLAPDGGAAPLVVGAVGGGGCLLASAGTGWWIGRDASDSPHGARRDSGYEVRD